ncbi:hypothetical protein MMC2321_03142 [Chitinophaga sp. MM2321]
MKFLLHLEQKNKNEKTFSIHIRSKLYTSEEQDKKIATQLLTVN